MARPQPLFASRAEQFLSTEETHEQPKATSELLWNDRTSGRHRAGSVDGARANTTRDTTSVSAELQRERVVFVRW